VRSGVPGRYYRSLRHLRWVQISGQVRQRLLGSAAPSPEPPRPPDLVVPRPEVDFLPAPAHARFEPPARVRLLDREVDFGDRVDWDHRREGPLWACHLHQFDYLRDPALSAGPRTELVLDWIARHRGGVGWSPYPTSLRILAWTKLLLGEGGLVTDTGARARVRASMARQIETLAGRLETHMLANHYLSNLLAVAVGSVAFDEAGLAPEHAEALRVELAEQIGPDGAHYERSPMYHSLLLESLLDLLNLGADRLPTVLAAELRDAAERMLGALRVWTHADGEIALFGDSAFGIAQPPEALERYASALGLSPRGPELEGVLASAGFVRLERPPFTLIASVAGPMPSYQPGHAHCDALAFELSLGKERFVTDTGVTEYVPGARRHQSRTTRAHATLEVDGREQAEIWAAHRVGGRPRVECVSVEPGRRLEATCASWSTPETVHRRTWTLAPGRLTMLDAIDGAPRPVRLTLPLAPGLDVHFESGVAIVAAEGRAGLEISLPEGLDWRIEQAPYFPEFGRSIERSLIVGTADWFPGGEWSFRPREVGR
jgi:uncharacterized heparinase superfamily protein